MNRNNKRATEWLCLERERISVHALCARHQHSTMTIVIYCASDNIIVCASFVFTSQLACMFWFRFSGHYMCALCTFGCLWCSAVFWPSFYDVLNIIIFITLIFPMFISSHRKAVATTATEAVASRERRKKNIWIKFYRCLFVGIVLILGALPAFLTASHNHDWQRNIDRGNR